MKKRRPMKLAAVAVLLTACLLFPIVAQASPIDYKNVLYEYYDDACTQFIATEIYGKPTSITIPDKVEGTKVTAIDYMECSTLKSVTIGKNVNKIFKPGFSKCPKLKKVTMNGYIKSIQKGSFNGVKGATFYIKANKKQFKKMKKAIQAAGAKNCKFKRK